MRSRAGQETTWLVEVDEWCRGKMWWPRALFLLWFAYQGGRVFLDPEARTLFAAINLGIHELGHVLWQPFGEFMAFLGGSLTQCLAPVASVFVFFKQRDYFGMVFCSGWLGLNFFEVGVYVSDARSMALPLVSPFAGVPVHDWNWILGRMGLLHMDRMLGTLFQGMGSACILFFLGIGGILCWRMAVLPERPPRIDFRSTRS